MNSILNNKSWDGLPPSSERAPHYVWNRITSGIESAYWDGQHWNVLDKKLTPSEFVNIGWQYLCTVSDAIDASYAEIDRLRELNVPVELVESAGLDTDSAALRAMCFPRLQDENYSQHALGHHILSERLRRHYVALRALDERLKN